MRAWALGLFVAVCAAASAAVLASRAAADVPLRTAPVSVASGGTSSAFDGVVQAVRQTVVAAQVAGAIVALDVKVGDTVKAGQVLLRIDSRSADHTAAASAAQVRAAQAAQEVATRDYERQKKLFGERYISQAALDRAEEQYKSKSAQAAAQAATALAARTDSDFYVVRAPYAGIVSDVPVVLGDMAMPGRALLTLYDPAVMRVSVPAPQTVANQVRNAESAQVELPGVVMGRITPVSAQLLPSVDAASHTQELRLLLPTGLPPLRPGTFAKVWLPVPTAAAPRLYVPASAVVRRAEVSAVYVVAAEGKPLLRQVRLGPSVADGVEVLSGLSEGEQVALDPQVAARIR